jgi:RNA-directed DNA polymerase
MNWKPQLSKYADDFIILHRDQAVIHQCQQLVTEWLQKLGLELHPTKTRLAHPLDPEGGKAGFDFLGFEIRQYPVSRHNAKGGCKTLIKASRDAIKRHYAHLCEIREQSGRSPGKPDRAAQSGDRWLEQILQSCSQQGRVPTPG